MSFATRTILNARVQAFSKIVGLPGDAFIGGPELNIPADNALRQSRYHLPFDGFRANEEFVPILSEEVNYIGPVYGHFGHIMAELIHRILPSMAKFQCRRWLAVTYIGGEVAYEQLPSAYLEALMFFGIGPENLHVINKNTTVTKLNVAEQGSDFGGGAKSWYLEMLRSFSHPRIDQSPDVIPLSEKVYVSRSCVPHGGNFVGESYVEKLLERQGFTVFRPENHSLMVQLKTYKASKILVFTEGSACHGCELLGSDSLNLVYLIIRRDTHVGAFLQLFRNRTKGIRCLQSMPFLGTIRTNVTGQPMPEFGMSAFDIDRLKQFFYYNEIADLENLDKGEYYKQSIYDLDQYFDFHAKANPLTSYGSPDTIRAVLYNEQRRNNAVMAETRMTLVPDLQGENYLNVLSSLHQILMPKTYLEIGCFSGDSMALAQCASIGIDPDLTKSRNVMSAKPIYMAFQMTSDDFFANHNPERLLGRPIDLAFLDGMHLFEFLLRDFINCERSCVQGSFIVMHDCVPTDAFVGDRINDEKRRPAHPDWWAGDVWKLLPILREYRPDLKVEVLDCHPTGLVLVSQLDRSSKKLQENYGKLLAKWSEVELVDYGLQRFITEAGLVKSRHYVEGMLEKKHSRTAGC